MKIRIEKARAERVNPVTADQMLAKADAGYSAAFIAAFHGYSRADTERAIKLARRRREMRERERADGLA